MMTILLLMTVISFGMRILPFFLSDYLENWSFLEKMGQVLPPCILILLVAHGLETVPFSTYPFALPEIIGLIGVVISQICFRSLLLSMGTGVLCHQFFLKML